MFIKENINLREAQISENNNSLKAKWQIIYGLQTRIFELEEENQ
jgi:hypothetical protein